jgi:DNA-binding response OmpR family regulator/serine phosphatase RsbU (regulator of sigma subunit)/anti-sigma regulatory factor (Ser/Thr protein kinase)
VSSTVGEGTTFSVRVPLGSDHLPADQIVTEEQAGAVGDRTSHLASDFMAEAMRWLEAGTEPSTASPEPAPSDDGRPRVLVVEDNADMREYIATLLRAEHEVATAVDGLDALQKVRAFAPDLVLTDVMMPNLDGFELLQKLQTDPATMGVPVIMLSARAGEEGTVEGLEAGADDYLVKPFSARELLARVRVNLELDRVRRVRSTLERSQGLLDQAQRLAKVGSWEVNLRTDSLVASEEVYRIYERTSEDFALLGYNGVVDALVHPDDRDLVRASLTGASVGSLLEYEARVVPNPGVERLVRVRGEVVETDDEGPRVLRGSIQDVTEQRRAENALATAKALEQSVAREHAIADELQRSLLPERSFDLEHLEVATYYRAGVEGTQVGGDWYDIIELGAGRTAFVVGDVMGRGVSAAAGMGQLRSAVRAFAKLDLPPADVLEYLDALVQDLAGDQIVTCVYAIFDSTDQSLRYANAGHLPPLLRASDGQVDKLEGAGPPLGAGYLGLTTERVQLRPSATVVFYTDGLVERRGRDIDAGIDALGEQVGMQRELPLAELPQTLVDALLPDGPDDDIAILVARVNAEPFEAAVSHRLGAETPAVSNARRIVAEQLSEWQVPSEVVDDVVLMVSELVTNAFIHGRPPIDLRLRSTGTEVVVEVMDRTTFRPRRRRAEHDDEHGRGLQIVSLLADRWGSRATGTGKSVWFSRMLARDRSGTGGS